jgi:hypothetical protein
VENIFWPKFFSLVFNSCAQPFTGNLINGIFAGKKILSVSDISDFGKEFFLGLKNYS